MGRTGGPWVREGNRLLPDSPCSDALPRHGDVLFARSRSPEEQPRSVKWTGAKDSSGLRGRAPDHAARRPAGRRPLPAVRGRYRRADVPRPCRAHRTGPFLRLRILPVPGGRGRRAVRGRLSRVGRRGRERHAAGGHPRGQGRGLRAPSAGPGRRPAAPGRRRHLRQRTRRRRQGEDPRGPRRTRHHDRRGPGRDGAQPAPAGGHALAGGRGRGRAPHRARGGRGPGGDHGGGCGDGTARVRG